jgi:hypothetical protein
VKRRTTKFDVESCSPFSQDNAAPQPVAGRIGGASLSGAGGKAPTGMVAASASARALRGMRFCRFSAGSRGVQCARKRKQRTSKSCAALPGHARSFTSPELEANLCEPHRARRLKPDGRGASMFGRCFMFQMFHRARFCVCNDWSYKISTDPEGARRNK